VLALIVVIATAMVPRSSWLPVVVDNLQTGARHGIVLATLTVAISTCVGILIGAVAAFRGTIWDSVASRMLEAASTFPAIALLAIMRAIDGTHPLRASIAALVLIRTPAVARVVRSHLFIILRSDYVMSARAIGAAPHQLLFRHTLPILVPPVVQSGISSCAIAIGLDTALAVIGFAGQDKGYSWGAWLGRCLAERNVEQAIVPSVFSVVALGALLTLADLMNDGSSILMDGPRPLRAEASGRR
jgi:peptide/nickel transport system permease protein